MTLFFESGGEPSTITIERFDLFVYRKRKTLEAELTRQTHGINQFGLGVTNMSQEHRIQCVARICFLCRQVISQMGKRTHFPVHHILHNNH
jgi:hypothetical protein